jgi:hypothetical protein
MPATGGAAVQITSDGGHSGEESPDGEAFFYSKPHEVAQGILRRPLSGGKDELIVRSSMPGWWAACDQGIYFAEITGREEYQNPPIPIKFWNGRTRKSSSIAMIENPVPLSNIGLSASCASRVLVWSQADHVDSDLMLVDNFR